MLYFKRAGKGRGKENKQRNEREQFPNECKFVPKIVGNQYVNLKYIGWVTTGSSQLEKHDVELKPGEP